LLGRCGIRLLLLRRSRIIAFGIRRRSGWIWYISDDGSTQNSPRILMFQTIGTFGAFIIDPFAIIAYTMGRIVQTIAIAGDQGLLCTVDISRACFGFLLRVLYTAALIGIWLVVAAWLIVVAGRGATRYVHVEQCSGGENNEREFHFSLSLIFCNK